MRDQRVKEVKQENVFLELNQAKSTLSFRPNFNTYVVDLTKWAIGDCKSL